VVAEPAAEGIQQHRFDRDAALFCKRPGVAKEDLAGLLHDAHDVAVHGAEALAAKCELHFVNHVQQLQTAAGELGQLDRFGQTEVGGFAAVYWYEDSLVHGVRPW
jgi:hypothetical protein